VRNVSYSVALIPANPWGLAPTTHHGPFTRDQLTAFLAACDRPQDCVCGLKVELGDGVRFTVAMFQGHEWLHKIGG